MLFLEDLSEEQKEWFYGDFIRGRRHFADGSFSSYIYSYSQTMDFDLEMGAHELGMFSYFVITDERSLLPVIPNLSDKATAEVMTPDGPQTIPFFNDENKDLKKIFGYSFSTIVVFCFHDFLNTLVIFNEDIKIDDSVSSDPQTIHARNTFASIDILSERCIAEEDE